MASLTGDDVILCQITSKTIKDSYAIPLTQADFKSGNLHQDSNIRPNCIFTADSNIILYRIGVITLEKTKEVAEKIIMIISA